VKIAKGIALVGLLAMTAILIYGFSAGDFSKEGKELLSMPWGIVYREGRSVRSVVWVILMMTLGFWAGSLYTLVALQTSGGDWRRFWMGKRGESASRSPLEID
jgi:hypothetical protein